MRILNVTQTYAPFFEFGGPPVKVRALSQGLARRGHEVTVLTADWNLEPRLGPELRARAERSPFGWRVRENGVQAIYLPTWLHRRTVTWNPALKRFCRARLVQFDAVHIFGMYDFLGPGVAAACGRIGLPYVFEPIGMFVPIVRSVFLKRLYHAFWGRHLAHSAAAVVATSDQEARELAAAGIAPDKIVLRRNGVEPPPQLPARGLFRARNKISETARVILFLGRLSSKKSPDLLLDAFASLPSSLGGAEMHLVFAGPDEEPMEARLRRQAAARGVSDRVHFTGPVFGDDKWSAYRDADVFVLPSQNENFGNTAAEAAVAGTPVIVTDRCGIAPWVAGTAGLVVGHTASEIALAIQRIFTEPALREQLRDGAAAAARRLGWDAPVEEMEALYARLASRRGR